MAKCNYWTPQALANMTCLHSEGYAWQIVRSSIDAMPPPHSAITIGVDVLRVG